MATKYFAVAAAILAVSTEASIQPLHHVHQSEQPRYNKHRKLTRQAPRSTASSFEEGRFYQPRLYDEDDIEQLVTNGNVGTERFDINLGHKWSSKDKTGGQSPQDFAKELQKALELIDAANKMNLLDEDDIEQLVTNGNVGTDKFNINLDHKWSSKDKTGGQSAVDFAKELQKALDLLNLADKVGMLDEDDVEQLVTSGNVGNESFNINLGHAWSSKDKTGGQSPQDFAKELQKAWDMVNLADKLGMLEEDELQSGLLPAMKKKIINFGHVVNKKAIAVEDWFTKPRTGSKNTDIYDEDEFASFTAPNGSRFNGRKVIFDDAEQSAIVKMTQTDFKNKANQLNRLRSLIEASKK